MFEHAQSLTAMPAKPQPSPLESPHYQQTAQCWVSPHTSGQEPAEQRAPCWPEQRTTVWTVTKTKTTYLPRCPPARCRLISCVTVAFSGLTVLRGSCSGLTSVGNTRTSRPVSSRHATPVWAFVLLFSPPPSLLKDRCHF